MYPGFSDYSAPSFQNSGLQNQDQANQMLGMTPMGNSGHLNYSGINSDLTRILTLSEKRDIETPRELFVNIKMLDLIERIYTFERIQENDYLEKTESIVKKIDKIKLIMTQKDSQFDMNTFIKNYGLGDCTWAIQRLNKKDDPDKNKAENSGLLIASVTTLFIRIEDLIAINAENTTVGDILPTLEQTKTNLDKLKPSFHTQKDPFLLGDQYKPVIEKLNLMKVNDKIPLKDLDDINKINDFVKSKFQIFLSRRN